jgi:hypothetical protein
MTDARKQADEIAAALEEARQAYNPAKKGGRARTQIDTRSLYLLIVGACTGYGVPLHDAQSGKLLVDPRDDDHPPHTRVMPNAGLN